MHQQQQFFYLDPNRAISGSQIKRKFIVCQELGVFSYGNDGKNYVGLANPGEFHSLRVVFQKVNGKNAINEDGVTMSD